ncbi:hypothetical protein [Streptomyces sp. NPDC004284]
MQHRTVFEVLTHDVVTAAPTTPFKEIEHDVLADTPRPAPTRSV